MPEAVLERLKSLHPKVIDLELTRINRLLAALGHPERRLPPVVHVAGTNGKGSTVATLRAFAEAAGQRVHVYTSPHLVRFNERIRLAGALIDDAALTALLEECERVNLGQPITFFEITTAAAFLAFSRAPAELCLLEVGLGGRVDATNVVEKPALCIITPVSLDHTDYLGKTLAAVAGEKAGILKPGVPCVVAAQAPEVLAAIEARAAEIGAPLFVEGRDWTVRRDGDALVYESQARRLTLPPPVLPGPHQTGNAGTALAAAELLGIGEPALSAGLGKVEWPARLQRLTGKLAACVPQAELWLDGGHNPAAGEMLAAVAAGWADKPLDVVWGMLNTKDARGFLKPLAPYIRSLRTVPVPGDPLGLPAEEMAAIGQAEGLADVASRTDVAAALASLPGDGRILICGSLYLAGAVLAAEG